MNTSLEEPLLPQDGVELMGPSKPSSSIPHPADEFNEPSPVITSPVMVLPAEPVEAPSFDAEGGFPTNAAARELCAKQWTTNRPIHGSTGVNSGRVNSDDAATRHTTRVRYTDVQTATDNFVGQRRIGDGGSCVVFRGELFGVPCAIKLLPEDASAFEAKQFVAEIDALSRVKHENICALYACSTDGPNRCVVLELMSCALEERMAVADPPLGWEQRVWIALCVVRGLVHLHSQSPPMIHRDIKSQNILLSGFETGSLDDISTAKVADFGTARIDDRNLDGKVHTSDPTHAHTRQVIGTTPYMPAEYTQLGHVSEKTDGFAFGIIVVELLVKRHCLQARALVDEHEFNTLPQELVELAMQNGWPKQVAKILSNVATDCTRGSKSRSTPAEVLAQVEEAHKIGSGATTARSFGGFFG
jgi:serine/threonine protein kinase